ncbi:MAG: ParB N-terminal domain-containing protein [Acidibrevibacterium sp.]|jgi:ParB family chromosome partitioning protein|uniref:ParB/RepB/Spo0J family partition protein n=1 Tax=Acidibrevibacterium fodinaquatile TaxID=1969806 RepID=UPI0023A800AE|nr:ParB/RepB/Spo0J family partition protein [Acidibrevibacterium fodinaquatile]MCA7120583.1 ParB N-terminal domain-containing protein [Acidibrevibacterium fodinaquatile]
MAATQKIVLNPSRDIPFNKLVLSQANVRRVKAGVSIEALAESIARRSLLQSLSVRPVLDAEGNETGMFEVPAGGRRFQALELLVRQKRLARTAPIPCIVKTEGLAEEDSLAENTDREALHPLDQFRAFQTLRAKGQGEEEIAAAFGVTAAVVRQRLKLAAASPALLEAYAEGAMTLDQLMAFCVSDDHARQEQVWATIQRGWNKEPHIIRRMLTEGAVRASDRRARFVGIEAYEAAGGIVMRDLFQDDDGGWFQDPALLDRLVAECLAREADAIRAEGWKWVEAAPDFPYGHRHGLRPLRGTNPLTEAEQAEFDTLKAEYDALEAQYGEADELPEAVEARLVEIEAAIEAFQNRPPKFDPADIVRAGVFVSIHRDGALRIERGYVRPEDEPPVAAPDDPDQAAEPASTVPDTDRDPSPTQARSTTTITPTDPSAEVPEEDEGLKPLPERLMMELTAHRTLALREALGNDWDTAFLAVLHALCLRLFYRSAADTCLEIEARSAGFGTQAPGLNDTASARAIDVRHEAWVKQLPATSGELWDALVGFDTDTRAALFAHCAALTINALHEPWNRRPGALAHADRLAQAVDLDMAAAGWVPTIETYLGRVPKARILEAVREAKGEHAAQLIDHLKKLEMAQEAERLLAGTGWLPEPLRTPGSPEAAAVPPAASDDEAEGTADGDADAITALPAFLIDADDPAVPQAIAAE